MTMQMGAGKSSGSAATRVRSASSPPAEVPMTTIRSLAMVKTRMLILLFVGKNPMSDADAAQPSQPHSDSVPSLVIGLGASAGGIVGA